MSDPDTLQVRDATAADHDHIRDVTLEAYAQYAEVLGAAWWDGYRRNVMEALTDEGVERIVAERHGRILGSVLLLPASRQTSGWPEVRLLAVAPQARRQGIGRALMDECVRRVRRRGTTTIGLHTMPMMDEARRMYERMGFVRAPEHDFSPVAGLLILGYRMVLVPETPTA
jgi:ribosomal protein S18 acetylase RimI-like enzyme